MIEVISYTRYFDIIKKNKKKLKTNIIFILKINKHDNL